jgi:uncharacterized damage-inducible protein DinB
MFRRVADFLQTWDEERKDTLRILRALDDRSLSSTSDGDQRTLGRLAWHLTTTLGEMMERTGLRVGGPPHDSPLPASASAIVEAYSKAAASVAEQVSGWTDATLEVEDDMYGQRWPRGRTLLALLVHQTHHRGQMTVLMRQAGLKVTGVYGPAREEWAAMGLQPPAI